MQEYTINEILNMFLKKWWLLVISAIVCGSIAFGYTLFFIPKTYKSSGMIYVNNREKMKQDYYTGANINDLYVAERLSESFKIILLTDKFLKYVVNDIDLDITTKQLVSMLNVSTINDTEVIRINAVCSDPVLANTILTSVLTNAKSQLSNILEVGYIRVIEDASFEPNPIGPNKKVNVLLGVFFGIVVSAAYIFIREITDTTIRTEADIENFFEIPLVGCIPDLDEAVDKNSYYVSSSK